MKNWKIATYLRLSKEDGDKDESDSIYSQRSIIKRFIDGNIENGEIIGEYVDDGYTGTNFNRPKFKKMISDIDNGKINCVIVKDLSRFGRDYIGVGEYLEKYFPSNDIRFIAINDGYDSLLATGNDDFIMPIKNIFNAQYSKDISRKVKSSFRTLQGDGKFVGAFASYGYMKDSTDRHKLIIDEPAAEIVRMIFDMYISGVGKISIAKKLNQKSIPCPSEYKRLSGLKYTNGQRIELTKYWTYSTVNNILKNEMYIGNMVQNKSVRKMVRGKAKKNDEENWTIVKNTHEAIIDLKKWNLVQELLKKNTRQLEMDSNVGIFAGYVFCGDCGRAMSKVKNKYSNKVVTTYICGSYKRYGADVCTRHAIKLDILEKLVLNKLNEQIEKAGELNLDLREKNNKKSDLKAYEISLARIYNLKKSIYEDYRSGVLTKDEYIAYKDDYTKEENMIKGQMESVSQAHCKNREMNEWVAKLLEIGKIDALDREVISEVLDKIVVKESKEEICIEIKFKIELN